MADLHLEFVSPENVLFSGAVDQVDLPGAEGDLGILADHAPMVTTLRPGIITIFREGRHESVVVTGGFAEVGPAGLTVLADRAVLRENFDVATLSAEIKDTEEDIADAANEGQRDELTRHLEQLKALQTALGAAETAAH